jgi:superfamily II DNA or RNA helicase
MNSAAETTILCKRGYSVLKSAFAPETLKPLLKELRVTPFTPGATFQRAEAFPVFLESPKRYYFPKHYGREHLGEAAETRLGKGLELPATLTFTGSLKPIQKEIIAAFEASLPKSQGGIISVPCGYGKTVMALYLITLLRRKTIIVVHKEFLINQWRRRIQEFIPSARIGVIQGPKVEVDDCDIVLAMLQSVSMKEYPDSVFESFGFTIVDECHHIAAEVFSRSLPKINSWFSLGLSATPKRTDGLHRVFHWFMGPMVYYLNKRSDANVQVRVIRYNCSDPAYCAEETTANGQVCVPRILNNVAGYWRRNEVIRELVKGLVEDNRKILILSDRREHLVTLEKLIQSFATVGYYVGGMKEAALDASEEKQVILGTYPMSSEGMDIPSLDSVVFATPRSNIEQSIGRITRKIHEQGAVAYDICDMFSVFKRQFFQRARVYKRLGYEVTYGTVWDDPGKSLEGLRATVGNLWGSAEPEPEPEATEADGGFDFVEDA